MGKAFFYALKLSPYRKLSNGNFTLIFCFIKTVTIKERTLLQLSNWIKWWTDACWLLWTAVLIDNDDHGSAIWPCFVLVNLNWFSFLRCLKNFWTIKLLFSTQQGWNKQMFTGDCWRPLLRHLRPVRKDPGAFVLPFIHLKMTAWLTYYSDGRVLSCM